MELDFAKQNCNLTSCPSRKPLMSALRCGWTGLFILSLITCLPTLFAGAQEVDPRLAKALSYVPVQPGVRYEKVDDDDLPNCNIEEIERDGVRGFWITGPAGQPLRWFADTNNDNRLDQWSYYNAGVEVYREIDEDFNGTADRFRWLATEGTRIGVDEDEDGQIDRWERISAEEVTAEVVAAAADRDARRFQCLLPDDEELKQLGVAPDKLKALRQRVERASTQFAKWASSSSAVPAGSQWTQFGADKPGVIPAGTDGSTKDVTVYENVVALFKHDDKPQQLLIGTLVRIGDAWRVIDLPTLVTEGATIEDSGIFFTASYTPRMPASSAGGLPPTMERLVSELQKIDERLLVHNVDGDQRAALHAQRADVLEKLISASEPGEERSIWIRQFADTVSAAAQVGEYPEGAARLRDFIKKLAAIDANDDDMAYVVYRAIETDYRVQSLKAKDDEIDAVLNKFLNNLKALVERFPKSPEAADAMVQIALSAEFAGEKEEAAQWYRRASQEFPQSIAGRKAAGALRRLELVGKPFRLTAKTLDGRTFQSAAYAGSPVIYHCWATWCDSCKAEMRALKRLQEKYGNKGLRIVGINFDDSREQALEFIKQNSYRWLQLYEEGGFESDLAVTHGILTLPLNFVVDAQGRVIRTGVHWSELEELVEQMLK